MRSRFALHAVRQPEPEIVEPGRAFDLKVALLLAATVAVVLMIAGALNAALGRAGLIIGTAVAGFADSQSAAISAAALTHTGHVTATTAAVATLTAADYQHAEQSRAGRRRRETALRSSRSGQASR